MSRRDRELAEQEQRRGDRIVARIREISARPDSPLYEALPRFRAAAQDAYGNAARHGEQPR